MTRRYTTIAALTVLLATAGGVPPAARAADDAGALQEKLRAVESAIETDRDRARRLAQEAAAQARQLDALRAEMRAAARAVQAHEAAVTRLEGERADLRAEMTAKRRSLAARRSELGMTLSALQRIALRPSSALLVAPGDPNDVVRSGLLIRTAIPRIETRAAALRAELDELAGLDAHIGANRRALEAAGTSLDGERARLAALVAEKNVLLSQTREEQEAAIARVEALTRESRDLGELLDALARSGEMRKAAPVPRPDGQTAETEPPAALQPAPLTSTIIGARGKLTRPAQGAIIVSFGDRNDFGSTARGITVRTRPSASVVSPWDGRVVFAGPFRHFGRILIIDHGEGYHSLIAGLARIDAGSGQWVLSGEPVGATGDSGSASDIRGDDKGGGGPSQGPESRAEGPTVYVEFRRNGQPINPLPWLAASVDRTNG